MSQRMQQAVFDVAQRLGRPRVILAGIYVHCLVIVIGWRDGGSMMQLVGQSLGAELLRAEAHRGERDEKEERNDLSIRSPHGRIISTPEDGSQPNGENPGNLHRRDAAGIACNGLHALACLSITPSRGVGVNR